MLNWLRIDLMHYFVYFLQAKKLKKTKNINTGHTVAYESRSNTYDAPFT